MQLTKPLMLFCMIGTLLVSGCMSTRITTDFKPEANPELKSPAGTFYISDLKHRARLEGMDDNQETANHEKFTHLFLNMLRKESIKRYPALFMDDPADAIPLGVEVESIVTMHNGKTVAWMFGTLLISGTILPCPLGQEEEVGLKVCVWTGEAGVKPVSLQKSFQREWHQWMSLLTPAGLIPIPGESDFPKASGSIFNTNPEKVYLEQLTQQLATAIAQLVVEKDAAFWEAQLRASPSLSPMPDPVILSIPTSTVNPF